MARLWGGGAWHLNTPFFPTSPHGDLAFARLQSTNSKLETSQIYLIFFALSFLLKLKNIWKKFEFCPIHDQRLQMHGENKEKEMMLNLM